MPNYKLNHLLVMLLACCAFQQTLQAQKPLHFLVEGTLTRSSQYCGGIHPSQEEEQELTSPKPLSTKVYVRKGKKNSTKTPIYDSTETDEKGHYEFRLPPGDYVILMPIQKNKKIISKLKKMRSKTLQVNMMCVKGWWNGGLHKITITNKNISGLDHQFHSRCFIPYPIPCIDYTGPYPP